MNIWLVSSNARKITKELQEKYSGLSWSGLLESDINRFFHKNKINSDMFLKIYIDDLKCFSWFQIGIFTYKNYFILVPQ